MPNTELFQPDAETAILSIILQNSNKIYELQNIRSFMFSSTPNQFLYSIIQELITQNLIPEVNLIDSYLKAQNKDVQVGGRDYLNYLVKLSFNQENLKEFERIVVDSYKARTLISLTSSVPNLVLSTTDINSIIEKLRGSLDSLTVTGGGESTVNLETALKSSWEDLLYRAANPGIRGKSTGYKTLDLSTSGFSEGDLWIIAGRPGMGKSAMFCNLMLNQGKNDIPSMIFSLEMRKAPLVERMLAIHTGINGTNIKLGILNQEDLDKLSDAIKQIKSYPIYIDSYYSGNVDYVVSTARKYKSLYNINVVYVDYLQLLAERNQESTHELGRISRSFKLVANELGIAFVAGSQLNRLVETRDDKRPILSDLRQSGNLEEDSDIVLGLYRDVKYNTKTPDKKLLELLILKQRSGPTGVLPLNFEEETLRITDKYDDKQSKTAGR